MSGVAEGVRPLPLDRDAPLVVALRRAVSTGALVLTTALAIATAPLWVPVTFVADRVLPGRTCTLRCGVFGVHYLACEWLGLACALGNVALRAVKRDAGSRGEWRRLARLQSLWAGWLLFGAQRIFGFRVELSGDDALAGGPMLLLMRHASLADTVLSAVFVSGRHGWPLRYVLKHELLWDPCLDVVGNRLPNYFVRRGSDDPEREVAGVLSLLDGLGRDEGVLIYPEGTRFTPAKREQVLARLRERSDRRGLARAEALHHTLPPRLGGTLALLEHNPGLDVVVGAHVGFDGAATASDLWSGALRDMRVRVHFWRIPYAQLPRDRAGRTEWLFEQWRRVDRWVGEHRAGSCIDSGSAR